MFTPPLFVNTKPVIHLKFILHMYEKRRYCKKSVITSGKITNTYCNLFAHFDGLIFSNNRCFIQNANLGKVILQTKGTLEN
jgi:hypothetical protein